MRRRRLALLGALALGAVACSDVFVGPPAAADYGSMFDDLWRQFDLHYSFFGLADVSWDSLGAAFRPRALAASDDAEFAQTLAAMLAQLRDVHVSLSPGGPGSTMRYLSPFDTAATYFDESAIFARYVPDARATPDGRIRYGFASDSIGYVRLRSFEGSGWAGDIDGVIDDLRGARAIVLDVRDNPGGNYVLAADVARRFVDARRVYGYVRRRNGARHDDFTGYIAETIEPAGRRFAGRVLVLTNRRSASSAEDFLLAMRANPAVVVVGDTTGGASGGPIVRELANGWTYQLSEWIEYTPDRVGFEGVGLAPTVFARNTARNAFYGTDAVIERALRLAGPR